MKYYLFIVLTCFHLVLFGQLETANWYFGQYMGMKFENDQIIPLSNGRLYTGEGCATMSDSNGNLLFYTDGTTVFNRLHTVMENGNNLFGNSSSTQSAIVIPFPGTTSKYVIFTVSADDAATPTSTTNKGFNFYYVDMELANGLGAVIHPTENRLLEISSEKIAAVKHINKKHYWVVTHFEDKFYAYLINETGVVRTPVVSQIGPSIDPRSYPVNSRGYLKISPNGKKLAIAHLSNLNYDSIPIENLPTISDRYYPTNGPFANSYPGFLGLYDFNKATGVVGNEIVLDESGSPYGVEFSPNSQILYSNSDYHYIDGGYYTSWLRGELNQYDLSVPSHRIPSTKRVIHTYYNQDTSSEIFTARGALQMALNQRIYLSRDQKTYVSHLKDPNNLANPQFEEIGVRFPFATWNVMTRYGLPPFISSSFERDIEIVGTSELSVCYGQEVQLRFLNSDDVTVSAYQWDFGDGTPYSNLASPIHTYTNAGVYTVKLKVQTVEYGEIEYEIQLTVMDQVVLTATELSACDMDNDGSIAFDLREANLNLAPMEGLTFRYFRTLEDAQRNINELPYNFTSTNNNEVVYVRGENEIGCFEITTITLNHLNGQTFQMEDIVLCVEDEAKTVQLNPYQDQIETFLDGQSILTITFYASLADLNESVNPITSFELFHQPVTVFAKVKYFDGICEDIIKLNFIPSFIPAFDVEDQVKCVEDAVVIQVPAGYRYEWIGLQGTDTAQNLQSNQIAIQHPGNYAVIISNAYGCQRRVEFSITNYPPVQVVDIFVENNRQIIVTAIGDRLQYSLDGINWQYENVFVNQESGIYTVYIKNEFGCIVAVNDVVIFRWTNFISPNADTANDQWIVNGLDKYENVKVKIFDRYGKILVEKYLQNEKIIWDGKYNGKLQPSDSYWYVIEIPGHTKYTGFVLLKNKN